MLHRGEIIKQALKDSGYSVSKLAERLGRSRRSMYHIFENPKVPIELVAEIGKIIHYDFSGEIKQLKSYQVANTAVANEPESEYIRRKSEAEAWKDKYLALLEKYNALLTGSSNGTKQSKPLPVKKKAVLKPARKKKN